MYKGVESPKAGLYGLHPERWLTRIGTVVGIGLPISFLLLSALFLFGDTQRAWISAAAETLAARIVQDKYAAEDLTVLLKYLLCGLVPLAGFFLFQGVRWRVMYLMFKIWGDRLQEAKEAVTYRTMGDSDGHVKLEEVKEGMDLKIHFLRGLLRDFEKIKDVDTAVLATNTLYGTKVGPHYIAIKTILAQYEGLRKKLSIGQLRDEDRNMLVNLQRTLDGELDRIPAEMVDRLYHKEFWWLERLQITIWLFAGSYLLWGIVYVGSLP